MRKNFYNSTNQDAVKNRQAVGRGLLLNSRPTAVFCLSIILQHAHYCVARLAVANAKVSGSVRGNVAIFETFHQKSKTFAPALCGKLF